MPGARGLAHRGEGRRLAVDPGFGITSGDVDSSIRSVIQRWCCSSVASLVGHVRISASRCLDDSAALAGDGGSWRGRRVKASGVAPTGAPRRRCGGAAQRVQTSSLQSVWHDRDSLAILGALGGHSAKHETGCSLQSHHSFTLHAGPSAPPPRSSFTSFL